MGPKSKIIAPESAQSSPQKVTIDNRSTDHNKLLTMIQRTGPRPTSPTEHCLRQGASPRKPKVRNAAG